MAHKKLERDSLSWWMKLITLGNRFSSRDFNDRLKKGFVEFLIVFFGVLVSFTVEQQGEEFDHREANIDNLINLRDELKDMREYTIEYTKQNEEITDMYIRQYKRWDNDSDSVFIDYGEDDEGKFSYAPMTFYTNNDPFDPPRIVYDAIKLDGTFRFLGPDIGRLVNNNYDGTQLRYIIINTSIEEKKYIDDYKRRLAYHWVFDLDEISVDIVSFWVENRKYIQNDRFIRYNLFERIVQWEQTTWQLNGYQKTLTENIEVLNNEIAEKESEIVILYWWFKRPSWLQSSPKSEPEEPQDQEQSVDQ